MSMDFTKTVYRPKRSDNRYRTSYALMSQWMGRKGSGQAYKREGLPQSYAIAMQGNAAFPTRNLRSAEGFEPARYMDSFDQQPAGISAQQASIDENVPVHLRYSEGQGHDDFHKAFNQISKHHPSKSFPDFGPPRLRHGRAGGSWRHVKEVLQAGGHRIVFVDGVVRWADGIKIDDVPCGHLINPQVRDIKSRYMSARPNEHGSSDPNTLTRSNTMI